MWPQIFTIPYNHIWNLVALCLRFSGSLTDTVRFTDLLTYLLWFYSKTWHDLADQPQWPTGVLFCQLILIPMTLITCHVTRYAILQKLKYFVMNICIVFTATKYYGHYSMKCNSFCLEISYYINTPDHKNSNPTGWIVLLWLIKW